MKKVIAILIILAAVTSPAFAQNFFKIAQSNMSAAKGQVLYDKGDYEGAISSLKKALEIRPQHGKATYHLIASLYKSGRVEEALAVGEKYINYSGEDGKQFDERERARSIPQIKEIYEGIKQEVEEEAEQKEVKVVETKKTVIKNEKEIFLQDKTQLSNTGTLILKSGRTLEGEILEKTDEYVKINFKGVDLTFYSDEIESVQ